MSEENVELVHEANDALTRRDLDALLALADPDIEVFPLIARLEGGSPYRGHDGVRRWWENWLHTAPDFSAEVEEVRDLGDVTVTRYRVRGHGIGSGASIEQTVWQVTRWRNGKIVSSSNYGTEDEALEAAGLSE